MFRRASAGILSMRNGMHKYDTTSSVNGANESIRPVYVGILPGEHFLCLCVLWIRGSWKRRVGTDLAKNTSLLQKERWVAESQRTEKWGNQPAALPPRAALLATSRFYKAYESTSPPLGNPSPLPQLEKQLPPVQWRWSSLLLLEAVEWSLGLRLWRARDRDTVTVNRWLE